LFYVHGLGARCLDVGGKQWWAEHQSVIIYGCNGTLAQQIRVRELDAVTHDISLQLPGSPFCIGVAIPAGRQVTAGQPLELQTCNGTARQRFAFDGDALLIGTQATGRVTREFVIEPDENSTNAHTRLVVGTRDVSDPEYFRMRAVDGSDAVPTSGFVRVHTEAELDAALRQGWGTVIEIDALSIELTSGSKLVRQGVTLRGYRKYTDNGPELSVSFGAGIRQAIQVEDHGRVTGLRLRGPSRADDSHLPKVSGIVVRDTGKMTDVILDHLDASDWTNAAINLFGSHGSDHPAECSYAGPYPRPTSVKVVGNFLHNNVGGHGYGVVSGDGAYPLVRGNVTYRNRHSITADGNGATGYNAYDNLVTSGSVRPSGEYATYQAFDVHGTDHPPGWFGGTSGDIVDMGWNTFLGTKHLNFNQRGTPCHYTFFHDNVSVQPPGSVVTQSVPPSMLIVAGNGQFSVPNPTRKLAVGDFDGDGLDDVFLGTGTTWWFSSAGKAEWRLLNRMPERADQLRFGDFDGDGRTDVLGVHGPRLEVSWAGGSPWTLVAAAGATISDVAVADLDGDRKADIFVADGSAWTYASAGTTWTHLAWSTRRTNEVRLGDLTGDGKADVFFIAGNQWQIVRGGGSGLWEPLRPALTSTVNGLVIADFDGDMHADVARHADGTWQYSARGTGGFVPLRAADESLAALPVGRFTDDAVADVLVWSGVHFAIAPGGRGPLTTWSRQEMR
jgi:hypothetical protein